MARAQDRPRRRSRREASSVTPEMLKQAVAAGVVTFLLASLIVGIETVSSTGALDFATRYKEVFIATIGVFVGSLVISQMRAGRPQVGVVVAGGVSCRCCCCSCWCRARPHAQGARCPSSR